MQPSSPVSRDAPTLFRGIRAALWGAGAATFLYFLAQGASYYQTPVPVRARHEQYWDLKPGGTLGLRFGAAGLLMMTLMHGYSARKRLRVLRGKGPLRQWLDVHIVLGVFGPLFVVLHTSFKVGGLVSISFWSMVAVALSGVFGRYLYLQIPRTKAGEELSLAEAEKAERALTEKLRSQLGADEALLRRLEEAAAPRGRGLASALVQLLASDLGLGPERRRMAALRRDMPALPPHLARELSAAVREKATLHRRVVLWDAVHRLFHHWHVVHRPFAIVMYVFVVVHVAVAAFAGYGWNWK